MVSEIFKTFSSLKKLTLNSPEDGHSTNCHSVVDFYSIPSNFEELIILGRDNIDTKWISVLIEKVLYQKLKILVY